MTLRDSVRTVVTHDRIRAAFVVTLVVAGAAFANGVTGYGGTTMAVAEEQADRPLGDRHPVVYPTDGVTVVATEGFPGHGESAGLAAFAPGGQPLYVDTSLDAYLAVEPDPDDDWSVRYVGMVEDDAANSGGEDLYVIERVDLETGTVDRLHAESTRVPDDSNVDEPRTVQQLPGGTSLVVDTEHNRVIEYSPAGEEVWHADIVRPHDAVRLDIDPEGDLALSVTGGPDAKDELGATAGINPPLDRQWLRPVGQYAWAGLEGAGLGWLLDLLPYWVLEEDLPALALLAGSLGSWVLAESWWALRDRV